MNCYKNTHQNNAKNYLPPMKMLCERFGLLLLGNSEILWLCLVWTGRIRGDGEPLGRLEACAKWVLLFIHWWNCLLMIPPALLSFSFCSFTIMETELEPRLWSLWEGFFRLGLGSPGINSKSFFMCDIWICFIMSLVWPKCWQNSQVFLGSHSNISLSCQL